MTKRIIGTYSSDKKGPLLFVTAAVHGNEPSGIKALEHIFKILKSEKPTINGTVVGIIGNTTAAQKKVRFIDEDLNRTWTKQTIATNTKVTNEQKEMFEIIETLQKFSESGFSERYFIDCHTTSSASLPYISVQEIGNNLAWAQRFPIHIIKGFSDIVKGTIDGYFSEKKLTGFAVEAGQHESKDAATYHEGIIWTALQEACDLNFEALSEIPKAVLKTKRSTPSQKTFTIIYRHGLEDGDAFKMQPGYENFQPIKKGDFLAIHNNKRIISQWDGYIFMPLYQEQGNDGFFVVQE
ncbi:succinylglutamate desuccinylase/aspartoacylase family protein [Lacinutrix sp. Hel_I_90]|uniref:succinylglutamate desuccinylase/aspartoacylase domain-containing protein n=1 Tax=Lacinutrix sp. Hel_I_90 TaxID=1249999 RepID=UPI0005CA5E65|nr:succinylglutamate desuccinylase/aspartoacylase family protein [Lacinutrix sp. Hel_I_90]